MGRSINMANSLAGLAPSPGDIGQKVAVADTPISFGAFGANTRAVLVTVGTATVSVTFDGTAPDTAVGNELPIGYREVWSKDLAAAAKFHQCSGAAVVYGSPLA